jgi:hypothetical protein
VSLAHNRPATSTPVQQPLNLVQVVVAVVAAIEAEVVRGGFNLGDKLGCNRLQRRIDRLG